MKKENILRTGAGVILTCVIVTVLFVMKNGVPVFGAPSPGDVERVTVSWAQGEPVDYTDPEKIELAVKLINSLNYQPFTQVPENSREVGPDVTITYIMKDGKKLTAAANWITGWWNGEARALKEPDMFVNLTEGIFHGERQE